MIRFIRFVSLFTYRHNDRFHLFDFNSPLSREDFIRTTQITNLTPTRWRRKKDEGTGKNVRPAVPPSPDLRWKVLLANISRTLDRFITSSLSIESRRRAVRGKLIQSIRLARFYHHLTEIGTTPRWRIQRNSLSFSIYLSYPVTSRLEFD